mmetsp:Transcript_30368/g.72812  ORF Transcript_30368/g.72812 Transcript_30368/m.72812 type:complete len:162 (-) Transcript_30368:160-645(-)
MQQANSASGIQSLCFFNKQVLRSWMFLARAQSKLMPTQSWHKPVSSNIFLPRCIFLDQTTEENPSKRYDGQSSFVNCGIECCNECTIRIPQMARSHCRDEHMTAGRAGVGRWSPPDTTGKMASMTYTDVDGWMPDASFVAAVRLEDPFERNDWNVLTLAMI